jgi:hypothetical protein
MAKSDEALRREQRLAAKLRENLKRRKQQARGKDEAAPQSSTEQPGPPKG